MKHKKGFTMVELLAVITILGILVLLIFPTIEKLTKENTNKVYEQQLDNIILSLKSWASDNRVFLPDEENEDLTITLGNLKSEGYIEYEVKNPLTGNCFDNGMALIITRVNNNYDYSIDLDTIQESDTCDANMNAPTIILNGNMIENIEVNSVYIDKGVSAKDRNGKDITNDVIINITGSGNSVDTSKVGNKYTITYTVTADGETASINRNVIVRDSVMPDLTIPDNIVIDKYITSLDVMEGVSATDNSGEEVNIVAKSNISFGIPGNYNITYTAVDSSGNTATQKRKVSILNEFSNGIMTSEYMCITNINRVCPSGTKVNVQVNANENYDFYVVKDTGSQLTLIMDRNVGNPVDWISESDYATANRDDNTVCSFTVCNDEGPLTAIAELERVTNNWTAVPTMTYTYSDENGKYPNILRNGIRARLLTYTEAISVHCKWNEKGTCPEWLYYNTDLDGTTELPEGYWLSTAYNFDGYSGGDIHTDATIYFHQVNYIPRIFGVRPVITLNK